MTFQIASVRRACAWLVIFLMGFGVALAAEPSHHVPYATGTHLQLVRQFYTAADGLPADQIRAVIVTRNGRVFAATPKGLVGFDGARWSKQSGPAEAAALFAPRTGPEALAGATNGIWSLANGDWTPEAGSPTDAIAFSAEPNGTPWALARSGVWRRDNGWTRIHVLDEDIAQPNGLLPRTADDALLASESGLFGLMGKRRYWMPLEIRPGGLLSRHVRGLAWLDEDHFFVATDKGLNVSDAGGAWQSLTGADGLPIENLTGVTVATDGTVWLGSYDGLMQLKEGRWTYLASKRWLPDNRVTAIAATTNGAVWVGTSKGLAHIFQRKLTLADKAAMLQRVIEGRDRRHGYVTEMQLRAPGVVEGARQEISDNDGLWTALYVAAQSFRYAATKTPEARAQAWRSMEAVLRLESISGISGFPARAICHVDEPESSPRMRSHPEWHESPVEKGWYWKGETSSDEIDGHYFAWYVFYELAGNDEQKQKVRATCKRVTDHILDKGYYLIDKDGQPTTWGVWAPEKLNDDPKWWEERGLNSLSILSHLKVAMHLVGDPRYEKACQELIHKHHYALNTLKAKIPGGVSHDDQLLFLVYYPLLQLERDPGLRALYTASIKRTWDFERIESNPLWNFIYGASTGDPCDVEAAVASLREIPVDFVQWKMENSRRADLEYDPGLQAQGIKQLVKPLPWTERVIHKWDKSPFLLDGGSDRTEGDPTIWLLPYWMGRHHRLID
jgi:hypothetical protein